MPEARPYFQYEPQGELLEQAAVVLDEIAALCKTGQEENSEG